MSEVARRHGLLTEQPHAYARGSRARSTWAAYDRQWRRFETWFAEMGETPLPAGVLTVARFLADLAPGWRPATPADPHHGVVDGQVRDRDGLRPGSIAGYLTAISVAHRSAGIPNAAASDVVRRTMAGIRRHAGVGATGRRATARRDDLATFLATLAPDEHPGRRPRRRAAADRLESRPAQ